MTDPAPLPPLFLAARALQRYRAGHEGFNTTRHTLRHHAASTADDREYRAILQLIAELRREHFAALDAERQRALKFKRSPTGDDPLTTWYAAMLGQQERPPAPPPAAAAPAPVPKRQQPVPPTGSNPTHMEITLQALTQARTEKKPPFQTHTRAVHAAMTRRADRTDEGHARAHAERWYQAIRQWHPIVRPGDKVEKLTVNSGSSNMIAVTGNWASSPKYLDARTIHTPIGDKNEQNLAAICNADPTLSAIRAGQTLATLVDPRGGWHPHKNNALQYAHVVLCLAFYLGDPQAQQHLQHLPRHEKLT